MCLGDAFAFGKSRSLYNPMFEYEHGRLTALLDLVNWIERHSESIKFHRLNNFAGLLAVVKCLLDNREAFQKYADTLELKVKRDGKKLLVSVADEQKH